MATVIPNLAPGPGEQPQFQPSLNASVQANCVHFNMQTDPLTIKTTIVPDQLMLQVVTLWLREHPDEADAIIKAIKNNRQHGLDFIRAVESTKNRS